MNIHLQTLTMPLAITLVCNKSLKRSSNIKTPVTLKTLSLSQEQSDVFPFLMVKLI